MSKPKEQFKKKLLVEGNDDQHVIWALCEKFSISENFDVVDCEGIENLLQQIPVRLKSSEITLGIIIDADTQLQQRWESLQNIFKKWNFEVSDTFPKVGLILQNADNLKIGVWIMPNNELHGMLEDFIKFLIPEEDKLFPEIGLFLAQIENDKLHKYADIHQSKALIHAWLALQETPGTPMGLAITKKYLSTDNEKCSLFIDWLTTLFKE